MMNTELSYKNDPAIKSALIARMDAHAAADEIIQGTGWEDGKGCFVGCSLDNYDHSRWPVELGLPEWLARLCDSIFEGLSNAEAKEFAVALPRAIPVGVDLSPVTHLIAVARIDRMLVEQRKALEAGHPQQVREAIAQAVLALEVGRRAHEAAAGGNVCELSAARSAARSAESAARSAWSAESAAWSAESAARSAESAAWSAESAESAAAAWSAAWSAESAAWSAESAAWSAESAARSAESAAAAWKQERDALFAALAKVGAK